MHEVGAPAVRLLIEAATRRGIDVTHALEALRAPREALRDPAARFDWDDYVQFIARLEVLAGGAAGMRRLGEDYVHASTELPALLALFDEPMDFFRFVITRYAPAMVTPLVPQFDRLSTDGFRVTVAIEPPYPPSAPLLCALEGALGALPAHTGQAGGEVQADIGEARATFVVRLPPRREPGPRTARDARRAEEARRVLEDIAGARLRAGAGARAHAAAADDATLAAVHALGVELGTCDDIDQLGRVLVEALRRPPFSYAHAALWLVDGASEPRLVKSAGDARTGGALTTRPLRVGAREVARLEFAGPKRGARTDALVDLVPWLVLAVDRALLAGVVRAHAPAAQAAADDSDAEFERRLERARSSWKLTPRQTACLGRLVRGRSNREISLDLGCTERTVEAHVAVVFRRARIRGRSSLVARFWSEPW